MDGEYLQTNGYSQAQVDIKLRILKVSMHVTRLDLVVG